MKKLYQKTETALLVITSVLILMTGVLSLFSRGSSWISVGILATANMSAIWVLLVFIKKYHIHDSCSGWKRDEKVANTKMLFLTSLLMTLGASLYHFCPAIDATRHQNPDTLMYLTSALFFSVLSFVSGWLSIKVFWQKDKYNPTVYLKNEFGSTVCFQAS
ncbi:MAG: hypothetical protein KA007_02575 [Candidatus Pacebacteria bacterium]|jgi:hypothetical protein|nr:hypothetical protein [Candidatus Paceibacterota bacterium]